MRVYFPCNVCALDEILVEGMTWHEAPRSRWAISYCLVHTHPDIARFLRWHEWLAWLCWNPVLLRATPEAL